LAMVRMNLKLSLRTLQSIGRPGPPMPLPKPNGSVAPPPAVRTPVADSWRVGAVPAARARFHVARERIGRFDALRIPQDLKTG
jgi:hypothetical protein